MTFVTTSIKDTRFDPVHHDDGTITETFQLQGLNQLKVRHPENVFVHLDWLTNKVLFYYTEKQMTTCHSTEKQ